jgi:DNA invertase Pin-like site-specific DNA recombinase
MPHRFRKSEPEEGQPSGPFQPIQLPTTLNLIVYPRQSTQAQVLHHATSTEMQTNDLIEIGIRYGWTREKCIVIDDDLGVSGTLGIDERIGLTKVMEQIDLLQTRAVLVVNEDRLFRDETMIQVNVFIKFMREHNAYVLTPYMVYNFQERFHVKMFREKAEYAAAYITEYVRERLAGARRKKALRGLYDGRPISPGYRVDYDKKRPDGSDNPTYQKFVIYEPHAAVVRQLAQVMHDQELTKTELYRYAMEHGIVFPEWEPWVDSRTRNRTKLVKVPGGWFYDSPHGLFSMITNPVYIGHWMLKGRIVQPNNHAAILPESLFMDLFNRLSYEDTNGDPNPQRRTYRNYPSSRQEHGSDDDGILLGLLYDLSGDFPLQASYHHIPVQRRELRIPTMYYYCYEPDRGPRRARWMVQAAVVDKPVSEAFLNRLRRSRIDYDPTLYERQAAARLAEVKHREKLLTAQLTEIQEQMDGNLRAMTLRGLTEDEMAFFLNRKRSLEIEKRAVEVKLETTRARHKEAQDISAVFKSIDDLLDNWTKLSIRQQRRYISRFVQMVGIKMSTTGICDIWIYWKNTLDESLEAAEIETLRVRLRRARSTDWTDERHELLRRIYTLPQVEIMKQIPDCTWGAIRRRMHRIGLDRQAALSRLGRWPEECAIRENISYNDWLLEHPDDPDPLPPMKMHPKHKRFWTAEENTILRENYHLPQLELMKLLPTRSWGAIMIHSRSLGLNRDSALAAQGIYTNPGFGKGSTILYSMNYLDYLAEQSRSSLPPAASGFDLNVFTENLSD